MRINGINNGNLEQQKQFNIQFGLLSSALEHAVPEQMFTNAQNPGEAISAVKALQKANAAGQRIYHITQANMASVLPNIHHNAKTKEEIQNALNAGKEVITHTDSVNVPGWSGAGYIILDSVTGDGAYKIGGGANGSFQEPNFGSFILSLFPSYFSLGDVAGIIFMLVPILLLTSFLANLFMALALFFLLFAEANKGSILGEYSCYIAIGLVIGGLFAALSFASVALGPISGTIIGALLSVEPGRTCSLYARIKPGVETDDYIQSYAV